MCGGWVLLSPKTAGSCAGALLAVGILNCGLQHENDPAYALLHDFVDKQDPVVRIGAIMGLGLAYAGTQKEEVRPPVDASSLSPCAQDSLGAGIPSLARSKSTRRDAVLEDNGRNGGMEAPAEHCNRVLCDVCD